MTVFVDTSAFFGLLNEHDASHAAAQDALERLSDDEERLVTHNYVVVECIALTQRRLGLAAVGALRDGLLPLVRQLWVDRELHDQALAATLAAGRRDVSLVDRVSFEVMRRHGLRRAFAFDGDFADQGFELVA